MKLNYLPLVALCLISGIAMAQAETIASKSETSKTPPTPEANPLGMVTSLEIDTFPARDFSAPERLDPEIAEYIRRQLEKQGKLNIASPGEATLHLYCEGHSCNKVRAEVTRGKRGTVVWQTKVRFAKNPFKTYKNSHKMVDTIVERLTQDYEKASSETLIHLDDKIGE